MNLKNISRGFGVIWVLTSLLWAILGIAGIFYGISWMEKTQAALDENLILVVDSLDSAVGLVDGATEAISATHQSLNSVQVSVHDASITLADLRPLLWRTTKVVTLDVPDALDGVQESMPSLTETAKSVDETLTWLSAFNLTVPNPFGKDWSYDLGIEYQPEVPLDQALVNMTQNLEDIPDDLRDLDESLSTTDANLVTMSDDLAYLAADMETMNQEIGALVPEMARISGNIADIRGAVDGAQASLPDAFQLIRRAMFIVLGLLIVTQIPSCYMGGLLVSGTLFTAQETAEPETHTQD